MRIEDATVIAHLNPARHFRTIRIAAVEQQFAGTEPSGVEVGKITARAAGAERLTALIGHEDVVHVEPHAEGTKGGDKQENFSVHAVRPWCWEEKRSPLQRGSRELPRGDVNCAPP